MNLLGHDDRRSLGSTKKNKRKVATTLTVTLLSLPSISLNSCVAMPALVSTVLRPGRVVLARLANSLTES
jgi:hypothetical protein